MNQAIYPAIVKAISAQKRIDSTAISLESTLEDLGISSLDAITIVYEIEDIFDIEVPTEQLESLRTVQDIVDGVTALVPPEPES